MNLTEKQVLTIAIEFIKDKGFREVKFMGDAKFNPRGSKSNDQSKDCWIVHFTHSIFQDEDAFVYIEDATGNIMFVLTAHGHKYIDGKKESETQDDDENWDDL